MLKFWAAVDGTMNEKETASYGGGLNQGTDYSTLPADSSDDIHSDAHNLLRRYALNSGMRPPLVQILSRSQIFFRDRKPFLLHVAQVFRCPIHLNQ
jgi:hypothetical protein